MSPSYSILRAWPPSHFSQVQQGVRVHVFDWGRSDLNTVERHRNLPEEHQLEHSEYWEYYVGGVDRLAWEAARMYFHRFGIQLLATSPAIMLAQHRYACWMVLPSSPRRTR